MTQRTSSIVPTPDEIISLLSPKPSISSQRHLPETVSVNNILSSYARQKRLQDQSTPQHSRTLISPITSPKRIDVHPVYTGDAFDLLCTYTSFSTRAGSLVVTSPSKASERVTRTSVFVLDEKDLSNDDGQFTYQGPSYRNWSDIHSEQSHPSGRATAPPITGSMKNSMRFSAYQMAQKSLSESKNMINSSMKRRVTRSTFPTSRTTSNAKRRTHLSTIEEESGSQHETILLDQDVDQTSQASFSRKSDRRTSGSGSFHRRTNESSSINLKKSDSKVGEIIDVEENDIRTPEIDEDTNQSSSVTQSIIIDIAEETDPIDVDQPMSQSRLSNLSSHSSTFRKSQGKQGRDEESKSTFLTYPTRPSSTRSMISTRRTRHFQNQDRSSIIDRSPISVESDDDNIINLADEMIIDEMDSDLERIFRSHSPIQLNRKEENDRLRLEVEEQIRIEEEENLRQEEVKLRLNEAEQTQEEDRVRIDDEQTQKEEEERVRLEEEQNKQSEIQSKTNEKKRKAEATKLKREEEKRKKEEKRVQDAKRREALKQQEEERKKAEEEHQQKEEEEERRRQEQAEAEETKRLEEEENKRREERRQEEEKEKDKLTKEAVEEKERQRLTEEENALVLAQEVKRKREDEEERLRKEEEERLQDAVQVEETGTTLKSRQTKKKAKSKSKRIELPKDIDHEPINLPQEENVILTEESTQEVQEETNKQTIIEQTVSTNEEEEITKQPKPLSKKQSRPKSKAKSQTKSFSSIEEIMLKDEQPSDSANDDTIINVDSISMQPPPKAISRTRRGVGPNTNGIQTSLSDSVPTVIQIDDIVDTSPSQEQDVRVTIGKSTFVHERPPTKEKSRRKPKRKEEIDDDSDIQEIGPISKRKRQQASKDPITHEPDLDLTAVVSEPEQPVFVIQTRRARAAQLEMLESKARAKGRGRR